MRQCRFIVPVVALIFAGVCFGQEQRPGPDPVQREITQARNAGRLADAEKLLRAAIHDLEEGDPKSPRLAVDLKQLSAIVMRRGDNAEAASILQKAYELDLSNFGPDDLRLTVDIGNMAWSTHGAGDDQKAEQMFNHVLEIVHSNEAKLQTLGDAEQAAGAVGTVISYYTVQKRWVDAEVLVREETKLCDMIPAEIREGYGDCGHLSGVLDEIYRGEGRHAEAAQLAPDSPFPAEIDALNKAAEKFAADAVYPSAEDAYSRAILLSEKLDADPQSRFNGSLTMMEMDSLARLYEKEGAKDKAEQTYLAAQEMREKRAGSVPSPRGFAMSLNPVNLVYLYQNEGRFNDAEAMLQRVIDLQVKYLGEKDHAVVDTLTTLAGVYEQAGEKDPEQYMQARATYERALSVQESMVGPQHPQLLVLLERLATVLEKLHDNAKAAEVKSRIAAISAAYGNRQR
ncbi:MAG TPA: tetratricopeptide repeat protein [Candidatus Saccharimonadales bacterium]|jgi:tetratricopeptide (TPR) repeat protein|nr:tetratricopeptide repeat protein [Candidatus Saccharimonadales bacterium]